MKLGMISLGCPKNLVDSEVMLGIIREKKLEITNNPEEADIIIVNTCGFIESAKQESIDTILEMAQYKEQGSCKYLIMTGCLGQRYADELFEAMPEVDAIVGTSCFIDIGWVIDQVMAGQRLLNLEKLSEMTSKNVKAVPRMLTTDSYMAYLKIAEGCNNRCSYCAIPFIRGKYVSEKYEDVLQEAKDLVASGVKELILVAQDTTVYGLDLYKKLMLPQLLRDLNEIEGLEWIRVMYLYPNNFTDELIECFATLPKVCKYIDIPLQHASDRLLKTMRRRDTRAQVEELLAKLRSRIPDITIRTTFIVGFPGETEEDFAELKDFVQKQRFEDAGVFMYSQEDGTEAGRMENQIDEETKENRFHELKAIQSAISQEIYREKEGRSMKAVIIGFGEDGIADARSEHEAPEVDNPIYVEGAEHLEVGDFVTIKISQGFSNGMVAELVEAE